MAAFVQDLRNVTPLLKARKAQFRQRVRSNRAKAQATASRLALVCPWMEKYSGMALSWASRLAVKKSARVCPSAMPSAQASVLGSAEEAVVAAPGAEASRSRSQCLPCSPPRSPAEFPAAKAAAPRNRSR